MMTKLPLGMAAALLLASATAGAASLVNRGGTSDVPTYQGTNRKFLIKAPGTSCPSDFTCFCNSGSTCVLPWSLVTGTVVIDRPGVILDCQNRMIQPPRHEGSNQQCTSSSQCGEHASGAQHQCVGGYCQLANLGGINVGGPFGVDDGSAINIDVNATGHVQDVQIRNCKVRNHYAGVVVNGFEGDDGLDSQQVWTSELRTNHVGLSMISTDDSEAFANYVHDNARDGMDLEYNWSLRVTTNTVRANGLRQIYFRGSRERPNRWLDIGANIVASTFRPDGNVFPIGNVLVHNVQGTLEGHCESEGALCDIFVESNIITADNDQGAVEFESSYDNGPTTLLRNNDMTQLWPFVDVLIVNNGFSHPSTFFMVSRCWDKGNVCHDEGSGSAACVTNLPNEFTNTWCWY
jgi:hypothetical protein